MATINTNATFGDIAKIKNGYAFKKTDFLQNGVPLIRQSNLGGTKVDLSGCVYLPASYLEKYKNFLLKKGDVLLGMSGSLGKICYYNLDQPALQNQRTGKVEITHPEKVTDRYFWYFLNTIESRLIGLSKGTGVNNVSASDIESLDIYLPSIDDQNNVTKKLDSYLPKVGMSSEKIVKVKQLLRKFRQSVLSAAVTGKLTEEWRDKHISKSGTQPRKYSHSKNPKVLFTKDHFNLFDIPEEWEWKQFWEVSIIKSNLVDPRKYQDAVLIAPDNIERDTGFLLEKKLVKDIKPISAKHLFNSGCIVYSKIRPYLNKLTRVNFEGLCSADMYPIETTLNTEYLEIYMLGNYFVRTISNIGDRTLLPKTNQEELYSMPVPVPTLEEQEEITKKVAMLLNIATNIETQILKSEKQVNKLTQSILAKAFRGEL